MTTTRVTAVWAALCAVTLLSWGLGHSSRGAQPSALLAGAALALALVKVRLVLRQFMEVATAPAWLRRATDGWLLAFGGAVLGLYVL